MKDNTVNRKAIELLNNGMITARVKELQLEQKEKSDITKERICKMLGFDSPTEVNINKDSEDMSREDMLDELERLEKLREE